MNRKSRLAIAAIAVVVSVAGVGIGFAQQSILNDPKRPDEERARDAGTKPLELYAFFGVESGSTVADLMPEGRGLPASCLVAVSGTHLGTLGNHRPHSLEEGDELVLITPVAGG